MKQYGTYQKSLSSEQRLLDIFEQAAVGIAQVSPEGRWMRLNQKYCEMLGYSHAELVGKTFQEMTHPGEVDEDIRCNRKLVEGEIDSYTLQKRYIRKDGNAVWVNLMVSMVRDERDRSLYSIAVAEDITEKKKAEEELEKSRRRERLAYEMIDNIRSEIDLNTILWQTVQGIGQFTKADRCLIWLYDSKAQRFQIPNAEREYCRGPEVTPFESIAQDFPGIECAVISDMPVFPYALGYTKIANLSDVLQVEGLTEADKRVIRLRDIKSFLHVPILYKNQFLGCIRVHSTVKHRQWDEETVSLIEHMAAKVAVAIHHAKTLQELKISEESLKRYAAKLQESNKDLEYFAMIASHDLQAPLRKVQLFSDHLYQSAMERLNNEERDDVCRIQKAISKMQVLINDLLNLSRVNRRGLPFRKMDLLTVVKDVVTDLQPLIKKTGGEVQIGEMLTAEMDESQMQSLILNLLENGLKFHREGVPPVVRISAKVTDPQHYEIIVQDNGIGIKKEYFNRIFQIFQRLHGESAYSGTGIGLSLAKRIADRHGANIQIDSTPGKGSTFIVTLPFSPPPPD